MLAFLPGALDPFMPLKAALLRLLGLPLLAWALLEWDADRRSPQGAGPAQPLDFAVLAWVLASVISALRSTAPHLSLLGEISQREGVLTTLSLAGLYAGSRRTHAQAAAREGTLTWWLGACAMAACYALAQLAGRDPLAWEQVARYPAGGIVFLRPGASVGNANLLGVVMAAALSAAVARAARPKVSLVWLGPAIGLIAVILVATLSRGAWLAGAAGVIVAVVMASAADTTSRMRAVRAAALALVPALLWAAFVARAGVLARAIEHTSAGATSLPARVDLARVALQIAREHLLTGGGPDTFGLLFAQAARATGLASGMRETLGTPLHAHAVPLQVLATLGIAGVVTGSAWLVCLARAWGSTGDRVARATLAPPLLALTVAGALNVTGLAGAAAFTVLGAMVVCTGVAVPDIAYVAARPPSRARRVSLVLAALLVAEALAQAIPEMRALREAAITRAALMQPAGDAATRAAALDVALAHSARMVARPPADDELWRWRAASLLAASQAGSGARDGRRDDVRDSTRDSLRDSLLGEAEAAAAKACALVPRRAENERCRADAHALLQASVAPRDSLAAPVR